MAVPNNTFSRQPDLEPVSFAPPDLKANLYSAGDSV